MWVTRPYKDNNPNDYQINDGETLTVLWAHGLTKDGIPIELSTFVYSNGQATVPLMKLGSGAVFTVLMYGLMGLLMVFTYVF